MRRAVCCVIWAAVLWGVAASSAEGTGLETTGPEATGLETTGPEAIGSEVAGSEATGSEATGSEATGSEVIGESGDEPARVRRSKMSAADYGLTRPSEDWRPGAYGQEKISLIDAVRLTLDHQPSIRLRGEESRVRLGLLQSLRGDYDWVFSSELSFDSLETELRASQKRSEEEARDNLRTRIESDEEERAGFQRVIDELDPLAADPTGFKVSDPDLQARIDVVNSLIEDAADNPERQARLFDLRDQTIADARREFQEEIDFIDLDLGDNRRDLERLGEVPETQEEYNGLFSMSMSRRFRSGVRFGPFFEHTLRGDNFVGKTTEVEFGGKGLHDVYRSTLGFEIDLPLLRGFGHQVAAAEETAAELDLRASILTLQHATAVSVLDTIVAYWHQVVDQERIEVLKEAVKRRQEIRTATRALVDADELPALEMDRIGARLTEAEANLAAAQEQARESRIALAETIGLTVESAQSAPLPADSLTVDVEQSGRALAGRLGALPSMALAHRLDLQASELLEESGGVLLEAARRSLKPKLDLSSRVWYSAVAESSTREALNGKWVGPSYNLTFEFERPFGNRAQKGLHLQARAGERLRHLESRDLRRRIEANVVLLTELLHQAHAQLKLADRNVELARRTVDAALEIFRYGESTLIDTLLTEETLTSALLTRLEAHRRWALLVNQLKLETGTLLSTNGDQAEFDNAVIAGLSPVTAPEPEGTTASEVAE